MANVLFKRGLQNNLPSGSNIVDGALYFTTDSKRLFLGNNGDSGLELLPIAEGITSVASVTSLPVAAQHAGEFYYVAPATYGGDAADAVGNILAYSDGTKWLQVNMSRYITGATETVSNDGTVTLQLNDNNGGNVSTSFQVIGNDNVTIGVENGKLKISVDDDVNTTYTIGTSTVSGNVSINLTPSEGTGSSVVLINDSEHNGIEVTQSVSGVNIAVAPTHLGLVDNQSLSYDALASGFQVSLTATNGANSSDSVDPIIAYGNSGNQSAHFVNGTATLSVPTSEEVRTAIANLEKTINAMRYMGAVSSAAAIPNATASSAYHNGDVYLASEAFTLNNKEVKAGSLIVIQGTEDSSTGTIPAANVNFEIVEGDSTDTTYHGETITHGLDIKNNNGGIVAELKLTAGSAIELTDTTSTLGGASSPNGNSIQVKHANITRTDPTQGSYSKDINGDSAVFTVVESVTSDAQGHITAVTTKQITIQDSFAVGSFSTTATASNNVATVTIASNGVNPIEMSFKLASTGSINVTGSGDTTTIDVVWGQF